MSKKLLKKLVVLSAVIGVLSTSLTVFAAEDYTVQSGDYLKKIAKQIYGDEGKWEVIYEANKDSIKNPNLIYEGQVFKIPDIEQMPSQTADETVPASDANVATENVTAPIVNVPVGTNPTYDKSRGQYTYTLTDGSKWTCQVFTAQYLVEATDAYGITYRGHVDANEEVMKMVADYIAKNPDSNFASMAKKCGNQFVIVSSLGWWDNEDNHYSWGSGIVDCEPNDCVYMFLAGFAEGEAEKNCTDLLNSVSNHYSMK